MKRNLFLVGKIIVLLVVAMYMASCASAPKIANTVAGSTWTYGPDEDGLSAKITFTDDKTVAFAANQSPVEGTYHDVDANGKNGKITILDFDDAKLAFAATMLQLGKYGTPEFTLLSKINDGNNPASLLGSKWSIQDSSGIVVTVSFLADGKVLAEGNIETSGTYRYLSAGFISLKLDNVGTITLTETPDGLQMNQLTFTKR
jgi:uncharacterized protein affecting Mg2+/Co2+ transport